MPVIAPMPAALLGVGSLTVAAGMVQAFRCWRLSRLLASTTPTPISALDAGLHEVRGALRGESVLEAPFSRRPCLYWRLVVEQRRRNRWETLFDRRQSGTAWLDDGGGKLDLPLDQSDVIVSGASRVSDGILGFPSGELTELLERLAVELPELAGPYVRYHEEVLVGGDRVSAIGEMRGDGTTWELSREGGQNVVSDRDETEVVRFQERLALRWAGVAVIGALIGSLTFFFNLGGAAP